jgi:hypothetical protein
MSELSNCLRNFNSSRFWRTTYLQSICSPPEEMDFMRVQAMGRRVAEEYEKAIMEAYFNSQLPNDILMTNQSSTTGYKAE